MTHRIPESRLAHTGRYSRVHICGLVSGQLVIGITGFDDTSGIEVGTAGVVHALHMKITIESRSLILKTSLGWQSFMLRLKGAALVSNIFSVLRRFRGNCARMALTRLVRLLASEYRTSSILHDFDAKGTVSSDLLPASAFPSEPRLPAIGDFPSKIRTFGTMYHLRTLRSTFPE